METKLTLDDADLDAETLHALTQSTCGLLREHVDAELVEQPGAAGTKGSAINVGSILLKAISESTISALGNVLRTLFTRRTSVKAVFKRGDGAEMVIEADNIDQSNFGATLEGLSDFFSGSQS